MKNFVRIKTIIQHLKDADFQISFTPDDFGILRYAAHSSETIQELDELLCEDLIDDHGILILENVKTLIDEGLIKGVKVGEYDSYGIITLIVKLDDRTAIVIG